jgi:ubiquinone/menaquinone biosynthesis C-methylase UbiE
MTDEQSIKSLSTERFNRFAQRYVDAGQLGKVPELSRLVEMAAPATGDRVLDIATGGGHTALAFAPYVAQVVATDLSMGMLEAARAFLNSSGAPDTLYVASDAEALAFPDATFDVVSCRIAQHHFPDCFRFVMECARVLKPGGRLVIQDQCVPEDERAARYIDSFERLRDPSHNRIYSVLEWRGMLLDSGLTVDESELARHRTRLTVWAERQDCPPDIIERLHILVAQAPDAVRDWLEPEDAGTSATTFSHVYVLMSGSKPV